jgi:hypothetical protein
MGVVWPPLEADSGGGQPPPNQLIFFSFISLFFFFFFFCKILFEGTIVTSKGFCQKNGHNVVPRDHFDIEAEAHHNDL